MVSISCNAVYPYYFVIFLDATGCATDSRAYVSEMWLSSFCLSRSMPSTLAPKTTVSACFSKLTLRLDMVDQCFHYILCFINGIDSQRASVKANLPGVWSWRLKPEQSCVFQRAETKRVLSAGRGWKKWSHYIFQCSSVEPGQVRGKWISAERTQCFNCFNFLVPWCSEGFLFKCPAPAPNTPEAGNDNNHQGRNVLRLALTSFKYSLDS